MLKKQILTGILFAAGFFSPAVFKINAQQANNQPARTIEEIKTADVVITANVTARELKFDVVPNPTVEFSGKPERITIWEADRQNLPKPVELG